MKAKTWSLLMCLAYLCALGLLFGVTWLAISPYTPKDDEADSFPLLARERKADYISEHIDEFDSFVLGGSKSAALNPDLLNEFLDGTFYSYNNSAGNFYDYEHILDFILRKKNNRVKQIILHLSVHEAQNYNRNGFMPSATHENPFARIFYKVKSFVLFYFNIGTFKEFRKDFKKELWMPSAQPRNGTNRIEFDRYWQERFNANSDEIEEHVLSYWVNYDEAIANLFNAEQSLLACDENIAALKRIKAKCDERGIALTVVFAPTFVAELFMYKSPQFWDYFRAIAEVQPFWNFSGINAVNMNPYNFVNGGHYFCFVGDRMMDIMFGEGKRDENMADFGGMDDFGQLITPDNADAYIARQTALWRALKEKYDTSGCHWSSSQYSGKNVWSQSSSSGK